MRGGMLQEGSADRTNGFGSGFEFRVFRDAAPRVLGRSFLMSPRAMQQLAFLIMVGMCALPFVGPYFGLSFLNSLRLVGGGFVALLILFGVQVFGRAR
jgi:hypothetical protein